MAGTIRKRDGRRLYHQIRRNTNKFLGPEFWIGIRTLELPSYRQLRYAVRNIWPRSIGFITKAWNTLSRFRVWIAKKMYKRLPKSMKKIVKKMSRIEARMHKILVCMQPRLERRYGRLIYPEGLSVKALKNQKKDFIKDFVNFVNNGNAEDEEVEYVEDCFDDIDRPKFGYIVKIMLKEKEPCQINFENPEQSTCNQTSNADNEERNRVDTGYWDYHAQSRQTGERFRSAAPPDCRISLVVCGGQTPAPASTPPDYNDDDYYDEIRLT